MLLILTSVVFLIDQIYGFPTGAPWTTCMTMFPKHQGTPRQTGPPGFGITVSTTTYAPEREISVILHALESNGTFKGVQVRVNPLYGDTERIVGQFTHYPADKTQTYDCLGGKQNMVTHKNNDPVSEVRLTWRAPAQSVGDVRFVATFVENFYTFHIGVTTTIKSLSAVRQPSDPIKTNPMADDIDWSGCGDTKGCFLYPRSCSGSNCYAAVTYRALKDSVFEFEAMSTTRAGYFSVGLSDDRTMGDDDTVTCTIRDTQPHVQRGYNHVKRFNERQLKAGITKTQVQFKDGRLLCRFTRPASMSIYLNKGHTDTKQFNIASQKYHLLMAWGKVYEGTDVIGYHKELPPISDQLVDFNSNEIHRGSSLPVLKQIHGSLMLVAWILFVGIGTVVARHYRDLYPRNKCAGTKIWFAIHRGVAVLAWTLTAASFILIFVVVDGLTTRGPVHGYLGIAVMSASTLQVLAGILRPGFESPIRPVFKWIHRLFGKATHILAAVTLFFAFKTSFITTVQKDFAFITLSVWVGLQVTWEVVFEICAWIRSRRGSKTIQSDSKGLQISENDDGSSASGCPVLLLVIYVPSLAVMVTAALLAVFLF